MIRSITLENFRSFGAAQTIKLGKLTVLVGPNNSGKSAFMSIGQLFSSMRRLDADAGWTPDDSFIHRPLTDGGTVFIEVEGTGGRYSTRLALAGRELVSSEESSTLDGRSPLPVDAEGAMPLFPNRAAGHSHHALSAPELCAASRIRAQPSLATRAVLDSAASALYSLARS
jgi:hypothetical protein